MRRKDREKDFDFALKVIDEAPYGVAAFTDMEGNPYAIQLSLVRIGDHLYFHSAKEGTKNDIIKQNPQVCVAFAANVIPAKSSFTTSYESAVVKGCVSEIIDDEEKIGALRALSVRFCPDNMDKFDRAIEMSLQRTAIYKITMEEVTAKAKHVSEKTEF